MKIQMVDLYGQYLKIKKEVDKGIQEVIKSSVFLKGGKVNELENNLRSYLNIKHAITCGNGTDALQIVLMALNLNEGDEVITTPFTFVSTLEVLALLNLKPVLADVDEDNFNIKAKTIKEKITPRTKAIIPVHLYGQCAPMQEIMNLAKEHKLFVIEDMCQALGSECTIDGSKQKAGTIGHIACNSFFPTKNLGAFGDGGAIFTNDESLAYTMRSIANHGMSKKYHYERIGLNSRLDAIQAAILDVKLKYLDNYIAKRQDAAANYNQLLANIPEIQIPMVENYNTHVFHQYTLKVKDKRDKLQEYLKTKNIPSMVYYPMPLHLQEAYKYLEYKKGELPVSENLCEQVLSLPMHTELTLEQQEYISKKIIEFFN